MYNTDRETGEKIMSTTDKAPTEQTTLSSYLQMLSLTERLQRLLLDVIKDEFERKGVLEINASQALLLFNIGDNEVTAGELKSRGFYQGSNVSYNLKKLVELGYMHHRRCETDRRSVHVKLTQKGQEIRNTVAALFKRHSAALCEKKIIDGPLLAEMTLMQNRIERYFAEQIRYIY
jgi:DNA-binding MarR family transcriptional regulator